MYVIPKEYTIGAIIHIKTKSFDVKNLLNSRNNTCLNNLSIYFIYHSLITNAFFIVLFLILKNI